MIRESQAKAMDRVFQLFTAFATTYRKVNKTSIFNALAFSRYAQIYIANLLKEPERISRAEDRDLHVMLMAGELDNESNLSIAIENCIKKNFKGEPEVATKEEEYPAEL